MIDEGFLTSNQKPSEFLHLSQETLTVISQEIFTNRFLSLTAHGELMNRKLTIAAAVGLTLGIAIVAFLATEVLSLDSRLISLDNKVQNLQTKIDSLNTGIAKIEKPILVTHLDIYDVNNKSPLLENYVKIVGSVTNVGLTTAFNAGLFVVATDNSGNVLVSMTVPITSGSYGLSGAYNNGAIV